MSHIDLLDCFLSGLVDGFAVFPVHGHTEQGLNPVEHHIFEIFQKIEIAGFGQVRLLVCKCSLSNSKFILVLVKTKHKKGEEAGDNSIESAKVRKHSIQFTIASCNSSVYGTGEDVELQKNGQVQVINNCCHNAFIHKVAGHQLLLNNGQKANICLNLIGPNESLNEGLLLQIDQQKQSFFIGDVGEGILVGCTDAGVQQHHRNWNESVPQHASCEESINHSRRRTSYGRCGIITDGQVQDNETSLGCSELSKYLHTLLLNAHVMLNIESVVLHIVEHGPHLPLTRKHLDGFGHQGAVSGVRVQFEYAPQLQDTRVEDANADCDVADWLV